LMLCALVSLSGCDYLKFWEKQKALESTFHNQPRMEILRELSPENCLILTGKIDLKRAYDGPLLVVAVSDRFQNREIVATRIIFSPAIYYSVLLPEGDYDVYVFADLNRDGFFHGDEAVGQTESGKSVSVVLKNAEDNILVKGPAIRVDADHPRKSGLPINTRVTAQQKYISLDDEFFDPRYGTMGLYRPTEFIAHTQGALFQLEEYDRNKTLIIFIHGVEGTPQDWRFLVERLDRKRFQPWFYYYPSGLRLEKLGTLLAQSIMLIDRTPGYGIDQLVIVAHSMGGLVARAAIDRLCRNGKPPYLKMYISMSSPYGGIDEARSGMEKAPVMIPSWRDVATDSQFLKDLYQVDLPEGVPFHMFFGYRNKSGASSDGTITLRSQLDARVYMKAVKTYGFDATHVGILNDDSVRQVFYGILQTTEP
jgi:pimeloyl-ACP methyl ester carboxylesterase